ncbi:linear amide C-N hydrolase [Carboxylicivirga linearis]|uniref:Choloylglycine hydrolase family protein n=1 Tax=Carboxylicivirga linearis TaxID=1628157 RepID=A0ABS5K063_9BACT|nr:choloylglycine hydrolase family protein [Carboxylicivirga linearis]MBS2100498.1 choloylglycine hydrolase family protein [Carboxylicivirga linearis]
MNKLSRIGAVLSMALMFLVPSKSDACTGIRLIAEDGGVVYGRTMEWGAFDLNSRVAVVPEGFKFSSLTPEGDNGMAYKVKYGFVALDIIGKDYFGDGMNEAGLAAGMFYHPNYAKFQEYNSADASKTISSQELLTYILSSFKDVEEVKKGMQEISVVGVIEKAIGMEVGAHWIVTDANGTSLVIEYSEGELMLHDAPLGVITNAPKYDWHMTNLNNYVNLTAHPQSPKKLNDITISPMGAGSGFLGMPGDNTPVSRFVRAVAWSQSARKTNDADETVYEVFRILDNFNLPLGPDGGEGASANFFDDSMRSTTLWTTAWNIQDRQLNYHTQHNRRVRMVDLKNINFSKIGKEIIHLSLDEKKEQDKIEVKLDL